MAITIINIKVDSEMTEEDILSRALEFASVFKSYFIDVTGKKLTLKSNR